MPTRINLLDWRAEVRDQRKQQFQVLLVGFLALGAVLDLGIVTYYNNTIEYQGQRNTFLQQQLVEMDRQIKEIQELERLKQSLLARMRIIEELQQSRSATVHFFDEIVNTLPEGVYVTHLKQEGNKILIDGVAESNGRISSYMKNFEASEWFKDPQLIVIRTIDKGGQRHSEFQLRVFNLTNPEVRAAEAAEELE